MLVQRITGTGITETNTHNCDSITSSSTPPYLSLPLRHKSPNTPLYSSLLVKVSLLHLFTVLSLSKFHSCTSVKFFLRTCSGSDNTYLCTSLFPRPTAYILNTEFLNWSGLVWSGLVWSGLVWSGLVWSGLVWSGRAITDGSGLVWSGLVWSCTTRVGPGRCADNTYLCTSLFPRSNRLTVRTMVGSGRVWSDSTCKLMVRTMVGSGRDWSDNTAN
jgi:hypothetical protein